MRLYKAFLNPSQAECLVEGRSHTTANASSGFRQQPCTKDGSAGATSEAVVASSETSSSSGQMKRQRTESDCAWANVHEAETETALGADKKAELMKCFSKKQA